MVIAIFAQEDKSACLRKDEEVAQKLQTTKVKSAASTLRNGMSEALAYTDFPHEPWLRIRSNNGIERINRKIRRRANAISCRLLSGWQEHADADLRGAPPRIDF